MIKPKAGQWYYVTWVDAVQDGAGDPAKARPVVRQFYGRFVIQRTLKFRRLTCLYFNFATGLDEYTQEEAGFMCVPVGMVLALEASTAPRAELTKEEINVRV